MQLLLQRRAQQQQQRLGGTQLISGNASCPVSNDPLMRQNRAAPNAMTTKVYDDRLKHPCQRDASEDANIKVHSLSGIITMPYCFYMIRMTLFVLFFMQQKVADEVGKLLNPNHAVLLKAAGTSGEMASGYLPIFSWMRKFIIHVIYYGLFISIWAEFASCQISVCRQTLLSAPPCILPGNIQLVQNLNQKLPGSLQVIVNIISVLICVQTHFKFIIFLYLLVLGP